VHGIIIVIIMNLWKRPFFVIKITESSAFMDTLMSHAIQIRPTGGPEVLNWTPIAVGEPGSGQVRLRQAAAGLDYIDVYHRTGYYSQPLPFIPGVEGAGTVEAIGQARFWRDGLSPFDPARRLDGASMRNRSGGA